MEKDNTLFNIQCWVTKTTSRGYAIETDTYNSIIRSIRDSHYIGIRCDARVIYGVKPINNVWSELIFEKGEVT